MQPFRRRLPAIDDDSNARHTRTTLPALTGLRGVAAWWVVIYHFREVIPRSNLNLCQSILDHGYLAVDMFFVLSGFIISLNYSDSFRFFSWHSYGRFLGLRLGRIYPLHLFMMAMYLLNPLAIILFSHEHFPGNRYSIAYYVMNLFLVQDWGFARDLAWNVPAWSISAEWFVYLVFPCIAIFGRLASTRWRAIIGILVCLTILYYSIQIVGEGIPESGLLRCLLEFIIGSLIYQLSRQKAEAERRPARSAIIVSFGLMVLVIMTSVPVYPVSASAWALLIYGLLNKNNLLSWLLSSKPIYILGELSYSTYLVHYFVRDWVKFTLLRGNVDPVLAFSIYLLGTATASLVLYRLIEVPGRKIIRKLVDQGLAPRTNLGRASHPSASS